MAGSDSFYLPLSSVATSIEKRETSPLALTREILERIERLDGRLHAYFTVTAKRALEDALKAEAEIAAGRYRGPLHGVPIGIKDLCDTSGVKTTAGTRVMAGRIPERDATVVARLRKAGAVILGKLATTEGAYAEHHPDYVPPVNPWNPGMWTGVSSSGSGVATAAGLCFASLGSDTGGSIRFPSAMNGVVGLKPTHGRVPLRGVFPMATSLDHVGPICRTVLDAAIVLAAIAGRDDEDPTSSCKPTEDYVAAARAPIDATRDRLQVLKGIRVGTLAPGATADLDPDVCHAVRRAVGQLADLGADVVEIALPSQAEELAASWVVTCGVEMLVAHHEYFPSRADDYGPSLRMLLEMARAIPATEYARMHIVRIGFANDLERLFDCVDVIACPSIGVLPPAGLSMLDPNAVSMMGRAMRFTAPFDYSGSPTISLPCGVGAANGVPLSLQLVGRHFEEASLLRVGAAYEAATEWHRQHPAI
jgi:amidase